MLSTSIGIAANLLLAGCGIPQAYKAVKTRKADDIDLSFLILWGIGDLLAMAYCILALNANPILMANYLLNAAIVLVIIRIKLLSIGKK